MKTEINSDIIYEKHFLRLDEDQRMMLMELNSGIVRDMLHYAVSAGAEYGLVATVAGAPAAPAAETLVDSIFASETIAKAIEVAQNVGSAFKVGKQVITAVLDAAKNFSGGFEAFYKKVLGVWKNLKNLVPEAMQNIDDFVGEIKDEIQQFIEMIADSLSETIQVVIPDASVGAAAATAVRGALTKASESMYSLVTGIIGKFKSLEEFIMNPAKARAAFGQMFDTFINLLNNVKGKLSDPNASFMNRATRFAVPGAAVGGLVGLAGGAFLASETGGKLTARGLDTAIEFLTSKKDQMLTLIENVFKVVFPVLFGMLASIQVLMSEDWKKEGSTSGAGASSSTGGGTSESMLYEGVTYSSDRFKKLAGIID